MKTLNYTKLCEDLAMYTNASLVITDEKGDRYYIPYHTKLCEAIDKYPNASIVVINEKGDKGYIPWSKFMHNPYEYTRRFKLCNLRISHIDYSE